MKLILERSKPSKVHSKKFREPPIVKGIEAAKGVQFVVGSERLDVSFACCVLWRLRGGQKNPEIQ